MDLSIWRRQVISENTLQEIACFYGFTVIKVKNQYIFRNKNNSLPVPGIENEVFIGLIPKDCFEDVLLPIFLQAGRIYNFRLKRGPCGYGRGYAFVLYYTKEEAVRTISQLHDYPIKPNWKLGLMPTENRCRLFASWRSFTHKEVIVKEILELSVNVIEIRMKEDTKGITAFIQYSDHLSAARGRKAFLSYHYNSMHTMQQPSVEWASPYMSDNKYREFNQVAVQDPVTGLITFRTDRTTTLNTFRPVNLPVSNIRRPILGAHSSQPEIQQDNRLVDSEYNAEPFDAMSIFGLDLNSPEFNEGLKRFMYLNSEFQQGR